ncbi:sphingosine-1-phosphate phosphatase 1 [Coregonus clupeaformis]|uniref:Phosphatidic acid phosphatase type 2/haloperoxidase domain-containing protein n=1 Tax=Coregonus suidteri TaxID=861788 RepID=A0AAN8L0J4_9TELE|nr:sphingosine-1-phosphate phosphatase 1 [Coregonus clupeaformis]
MAKDLKTMFIRCCGYLQDAHHVASFQKLCGVQGTFPVKLIRKEWEHDIHLNCACVKRHQDQSGNSEEHVAVGEQQIEGPRQRKSVTPGEQHNDCSNDLQNGTALVSGMGETTEQEIVSHEENRQSSGCRMTGYPSKAVESDSENGDSRVKPLRRNSLTGDVGQEFIIHNKFLFYLFTFGSELGNEMFFLVFFPFLIWNVDAFVSRRILVVWIWNLFLGQSTKDIVRWTRPASPPVVKVEVFYNSEYSMPSTHAMSGTAIPFSLFLLTYGRWQYPFLFGLSVAICWSFLVCVSRVYMGMHSVLEVIIGFLYSLLILALFQSTLDQIDSFYLTSHHAPLVIVILHVGLGLLAFTLDSWSTSRGDTAQALGTGAGAALASHLNHQLGLLADPPLSTLPLALPPLSAALLARSLLRLLVGVVVLLATRAAMKAATIPLACRVFGLPAGDVRQARQHMEVELSYRYIVYGSVSFSCVCLVPLLFSYLNLS